MWKTKFFCFLSSHDPRATMRRYFPRRPASVALQSCTWERKRLRNCVARTASRRSATSPCFLVRNFNLERGRRSQSRLPAMPLIGADRVSAELPAFASATWESGVNESTRRSERDSFWRDNLNALRSFLHRNPKKQDSAGNDHDEKQRLLHFRHWSASARHPKPPPSPQVFPRSVVLVGAPRSPRKPELGNEVVKTHGIFPTR